jgi:hypothetical protein
VDEGVLGAGGGWQIFMHSIRRFLRCDSPDFTVAHVTGDLWRLRPTAAFGGFTRRAILDICLERQPQAESVRKFRTTWSSGAMK